MNPENTHENRLAALLRSKLTGPQLAGFFDDTDDRDPVWERAADCLCDWLAQEVANDVIVRLQGPTAYEEWSEDEPRATQIASVYPISLRSGCWHGASDGMYVCTRPNGHDGPHVAHLNERRAVAWWPQAEARKGAA